MKRKDTQTKPRKEPLAYFLCRSSCGSCSFKTVCPSKKHPCPAVALSPNPETDGWYPTPAPLANQYVDTWMPVRLELPKPYFDDYPGNDIGLRLFSVRFRDFIEEHKQPKDRFQWLENPVICGNEERPYFILHFYDADDVLDESRIVWNTPTKLDQPDKRTIQVPAFSARKIQGYSIFTYDSGYTFNSDDIYVSKELKQAILKAKMTGVKFEATRVTNDLGEE